MDCFLFSYLLFLLCLLKMVEWGYDEESEKLNKEDPCSHLVTIPGQNKLFSVVIDGIPAYSCCKCPAGKKLTYFCRIKWLSPTQKGASLLYNVVSCVPGSVNSTGCVPCENGTYISEPLHNLTECNIDNKKCPPGQIKISATLAEAPKCVCPDGKYKGDDGRCKPHSPCPVGQGVKVTATHERDTECEVCPNGFESNSISTVETCHLKVFNSINIDATSFTAFDNWTSVTVLGSLFGVAVLLIFVVVGCCCKRKTKKRKKKKKEKKKNRKKKKRKKKKKEKLTNINTEETEKETAVQIKTYSRPVQHRDKGPSTNTNSMKRNSTQNKIMEAIKTKLAEVIGNRNDVYDLYRRFSQSQNSEQFVGDQKSKVCHSTSECFHETFAELQKTCSIDVFSPCAIRDYFRHKMQNSYADAVNSCLPTDQQD